MATTVLCAQVEDRVNRVLSQFLPTELDLVDVQRGGAATADVEAYLVGPRPVLDSFPSISTAAERYEVLEWRPASLDTGRLGYNAHVTVKVHVDNEGAYDAARMQDLSQRYLAGVIRVIMKKDGLETADDPVRFATFVEPEGEATLLTEAQSSGAQIRTVTIPLRVQIWESLT